MTKMRAVLVCNGDADDVSVWSGTPYHMKQALAAHFDFLPLPGSPWPAWFQGAARWTTRLSRGRIDLRWTGASRRAADRLGDRIAALSPDVVICVSVTPFTAFLARRFRTVHVTDATLHLMRPYYPGFRRLLASGMRRAEAMERDAITGSILTSYPSEWARTSAVRDYGMPEARAPFIRWGANLTVAPGADVRRSNPFRLLFVGYDWTRKGGDTAIAAVERLRRDGIDAHLDVVGTDASVLTGAAPAFVTFHGRLSKDRAQERERLDRLYREASLFILPTQQEALGIVLAEAAHYGLPVLTCATGGTSAMLLDGETGYLLPVDADGAAFAARARLLLEDPEAWARFSEGARAFATRHLTWDAWATELAAAIRTAPPR